MAEVTVVMPNNINRHNPAPSCIGQDLKIKINTVIGNTSDHDNIDTELTKLQGFFGCGAFATTDLDIDSDMPINNLTQTEVITENMRSNQRNR
ncbi:phosphomethylpyrimidine synthase ThiC [Chloroflexota bacterium]